MHVFDTFVQTMPDGTYLTSLTQNDQQVQDPGRRAVRDARVLVHAQPRRPREWLKDPELEVVETKKGNAPGSEFTLYADQVTRRCR